MVLEQAVGIGLGYGFNVLGVELEEVRAVPCLAKERFAVVAAIVDVVVLARREWLIWHAAIIGTK
jgi:hypothetical protein